MILYYRYLPVEMLKKKLYHKKGTKYRRNSNQENKDSCGNQGTKTRQKKEKYTTKNIK